MADLWRRGGQVGVDENVAGRGGDEVGGEIAAADIVEVWGDAERGSGRGPVGVGLGLKRRGEEDEEGGQGKKARMIVDSRVGCGTGCGW